MFRTSRRFFQAHLLTCLRHTFREFLPDPSTLDFGEVCPYTAKQIDLTVINPLSRCILVELDVNCPELRRTRPKEHLIRPNSKFQIAITLEVSELGRLQR